jgi:hypothetical protein
MAAECLSTSAFCDLHPTNPLLVDCIMQAKRRGPRATRRDHAWVEERSRALHARIAEKLRTEPALLSVAVDNLDRWERLRGQDPAVDEWRALLELPLPDLLRLLADESDNAARLRHRRHTVHAVMEIQLLYDDFRGRSRGEPDLLSAAPRIQRTR